MDRSSTDSADRSSTSVLTAAHCLKTRSTLRFDHVILGEHTGSTDVDCNIYRDNNGEEIKRDCADPAEQYKVESFEIHPDYNRPKFANDIGLIRVERDSTWKYHIHPICLPVTLEPRAKQFERYVVTENQTGSDVLLEAILPRVDNANCQQKMAENRLNVALSAKQMCAEGERLVDTCRGDSGGLLGFSTNLNGARFVQFGIVSAGVTREERVQNLQPGGQLYGLDRAEHQTLRLVEKSVNESDCIFEFTRNCTANLHFSNENFCFAPSRWPFDVLSGSKCNLRWSLP